MGKKFLHFLTLFSSASTLICCALPALFVSLGLGATFAGLVGNFPQLIWLSEHKILVFSFGGGMLLLGGILQLRAGKEACPIDPILREACMETKSWSKPIYFVSLSLYLIGAFFAFLAPRFLS